MHRLMVGVIDVARVRFHREQRVEPSMNACLNKIRHLLNACLIPSKKHVYSTLQPYMTQEMEYRNQMSVSSVGWMNLQLCKQRGTEPA
jgi:hypothetical protein